MDSLEEVRQNRFSNSKTFGQFRSTLGFFSVLPPFFFFFSFFHQSIRIKRQLTNEEKCRQIRRKKSNFVDYTPQQPRTFVIWHFHKTPNNSVRVNELLEDLLHPIITHRVLSYNANSWVNFPYSKYRQGCWGCRRGGRKNFRVPYTRGYYTPRSSFSVHRSKTVHIIRTHCCK